MVSDVNLHPYIVGRKSPNSLYDENLSAGNFVTLMEQHSM